MISYCLDTSVIIPYIKNDSETIRVVEQLDGDITSSFVCLSELYEGVARVKEKKHVENGILTFFAGLSHVYGLDYEIAKSFGHLRAELKKTGKVIEDFDLILAATCLVNNLTLVTYNPNHFQRIPNLKLLNIP